MNNVLLVDDEQLDLEVLQRFTPWEQLDMVIVGTVHGGRAALNLLQEKHVDILITDIQMPMMSGLELAEQARSLFPHLKIIFISAYDDFQYAKKAITMNASSYILKPVDDQELLNTLQLVREQLKYEREQMKKEEEMDSSIPLLQNEMMYQWLRGTIEYSKLYRFLEKWGFFWHGGQCCVSIIELDDMAWKLKTFSDDQRRFAIDHVFRLISDFIQVRQLGIYCKTGDDKIVIVMGGCELDPSETMQTLVDHVRSHSNLTITVGLGSTVDSLQDAPHSYLKASEALATKMFIGKCRVITMEQTEGEIVKQSLDLEQIMEKMFAATVNYDPVLIHDSLEQLFKLVQSLKDKLSAYNFALYAISKTDFFLQSLNVSLYDLLSIDLKNLNVLYDFETIDDIKSWLRRQVYEVSEHLHNKRKNPNRKLIDEIERYVEANLETSLQLRNVAKVFGFSPNYLGYLFKEVTDEQFGDFVTRKRMEKARQFLQDPKLKIFEAAHLVGYQNLTMFSRHFKQSFGLPPADYRKQGQGSK
ncbi:response regulator [Paenibacillus azoreducens]|uniref:response regulator n=1 Tax=Paenibacillus azoreducens TaxID=116718 RepID=UPI0039F46B0D